MMIFNHFICRLRGHRWGEWQRTDPQGKEGLSSFESIFSIFGESRFRFCECCHEREGQGLLSEVVEVLGGLPVLRPEDLVRWREDLKR